MKRCVQIVRNGWLLRYEPMHVMKLGVLDYLSVITPNIPINCTFRHLYQALMANKLVPKKLNLVLFFDPMDD